METSLSSQEHTTWKQLVNKLTAESQEIDKNNHVSKPTSELDKHKDIFIAKLTTENVHTTHQVLQQWQNCTTRTYRFTNQYQSMPQAVPRLQRWRGGCVQAMAGLEDHARICEKQLKWTSLVWRSPAWVKVKHCQLVCTLVMCCPPCSIPTFLYKHRGTAELLLWLSSQPKCPWPLQRVKQHFVQTGQLRNQTRFTRHFYFSPISRAY